MRLLHSVVPELKNAAIIVMVPFAAVLMAGCGALDSGGGDDLLDMVLPGTEEIALTDMAAFAAGEAPRVRRRTGTGRIRASPKWGFLRERSKHRCWG